MKLLNFFLIFFLFIPSIYGNSFLKSIFKKSYFGKPLISEIHSTISKVEIGYDKNYDEYNMEDVSTPLDRPLVIVDLGIDIPLFDINFGRKDGIYKWGISISLPLSVHILEDMFEPQTAPLLNTDYRFGTPKLSVIYRFSKNNFIKNLTFNWLPMFHECTHLGDEIIIHRMDVGLPITRINISYEYTELSLTLNDPEDIRDQNIHTFKAGMIYRMTDDGYGWFGVREDIEMREPVEIEHSDIRTEFYFDYQFQRSEGFLASKNAINVFAIEARNRVRLGYPMFKKDGDSWEVKKAEESLKWSFNIYLGYYFYAGDSSNHKIGTFFRFYQGVNPFGQMRNYPNYRFFGLSLSYIP